MAGRKLTVVISQAPGKNPVKRKLEEDVATQLMLSGTCEVSVVPHLYDLTADHTGMVWLKSLKGNLVVLGWLFPRAIRWVLDRNGVKGQEAESRLNVIPDDDAEDEENAGAANEEVSEESKPKGIGSLNAPNRLVYAIDLRDHTDAKVYIDEIQRIAEQTSTPLVQLSLGGLGNNGSPASNKGNNGSNLLPIVSPIETSGVDGANGSAKNGNGANGIAATVAAALGASTFGAISDVAASPTPVTFTGDETRRRWYPVIDYSRCTNCMECIDFCLFGVYGVDNADRILVEQQDNCKKGCPACSRVCPVNAIIFPEHKTPTIAGAAGGGAMDFKIDLSKLFGAPSALEQAVLERDTELVADGRQAVGATVGVPKRQCGQATKPRDSLDDLMDGLDSLDL